MGNFLGVLMLETRFPRPPGDIGNAATFDFPVRYEVVAGASPERVVRERAQYLLPRFIAAGEHLCAQGARAIGTSCGFLALFQRELAAVLPVPVATSSLLQVGWLRAMWRPETPIGVLTIDGEALSKEHLSAVSAAGDTPIEGVRRDGEFARRILNDEPELDFEMAQRDVVEAAERLVKRRPDIAAIVLECTNMPPYAAAVRRATGRPVFDGVTLLRWVWTGLAPR